MVLLAILPILFNVGAPQQPAAGPGIQPYRVEAETNDVRVARVMLGPGERTTAESAGGTVVVYLTADPDGRMPASDAVWAAAGSVAFENHGPARFEAVLIQFKNAPVARSAAAEPRPRYRAGLVTMPIWPAYAFGEYPTDRIESQRLVDTPDVRVTKERYPGLPYLEPLRISANDTVVVYLRNGYAWPSEPALQFQGAVRVHRGDVRVIPANVPYALTNPATDPSEFVVVAR